MQVPVKAYIGMGSNLGDGKRTLRDAWQSLGELEGVSTLQLSSPYLSAPVDMVSQHWFTNAVGELETTLTPIELLHTLLEVEKDFGRVRDSSRFGYQDRSLDLDLLFYGDTVTDTPELILPHPHVAKRLFVLQPLLEISSHFVHHVSGDSVNKMIRRLEKSIANTENKQQEILRSSWED